MNNMKLFFEEWYEPGVNRLLDPNWHRNRPDTVAIAKHIGDDPATFPLL
jgi:hypothetical protein